MISKKRVPHLRDSFFMRSGGLKQDDTKNLRDYFDSS